MAFFLEAKRNTDFLTPNNPSPGTTPLMKSITQSTQKRKDPVLMRLSIRQQNLIALSANQLKNSRITICRRKKHTHSNRITFM